MSFISTISMSSSFDLPSGGDDGMGRLIIASNRLPVTIKPIAPPEQDVQQSEHVDEDKTEAAAQDQEQAEGQEKASFMNHDTVQDTNHDMNHDTESDTNHIANHDMNHITNQDTNHDVNHESDDAVNHDNDESNDVANYGREDDVEGSEAPASTEVVEAPTTDAATDATLDDASVIDIEQQPEKYEYKTSSGGLVSGLGGVLKEKKFLWYGWPGLEVPTEDMSTVEIRLKEEHSCVPVWYDEQLADHHYNGFSNEILWALLHYHHGDVQYSEVAWRAYQTVNELFAKRMIEDLLDGDIVWCHDYHLMLLPMYLRQMADAKGISIKIAWFLHTPWPSSEIWRLLPCRVNLLEGLLHADLLGFHTHDYLRHFVSSCNRLLVASTTPTTMKHKGRTAHLGAFPIGIDPVKFAEGFNKAAVQERIKFYQDQFRGTRAGDVKVIVGCDRLDYIKAIPHKLYAFQNLLAKHPELVGKVQLVQIAIPTRGDVVEYQALRKLVNELVGNINSTYGTIEFNPVHLKHTSVGHTDLTALFAISDACLITSTRDGMNLVAYEYIACQEERKGTLILSEFTGCAQAFAKGAIIIQPWDIAGVSDAMHLAVTLTDEERVERHTKLWNHVHKYTSAWWGETFLDHLLRVTEETADDEDTNELVPIRSASSAHEAAGSRRRRRTSSASKHWHLPRQYTSRHRHQTKEQDQIAELLAKYGGKTTVDFHGNTIYDDAVYDCVPPGVQHASMLEAFPDYYHSQALLHSRLFNGEATEEEFRAAVERGLAMQEMILSETGDGDGADEETPD